MRKNSVPKEIGVVPKNAFFFAETTLRLASGPKGSRMTAYVGLYSLDDEKDLK